MTHTTKTPSHEQNWAFITGAILTFFGALLHIAIILGGADWYRASGAGEGLAVLAESGSLYPAFLGSILTSIFFGWSIYALSGAGLIRRLPFLKAALIAIALLCTVRGLYGFVIPIIIQSEYVIKLGTAFWLYSSAIWLAIGLCYAAGLRKNWQYLSSQ